MMIPFAVIRAIGGEKRFKKKAKSVLKLMNLRYPWYRCGEIN